VPLVGAGLWITGFAGSANALSIEKVNCASTKKAANRIVVGFNISGLIHFIEMPAYISSSSPHEQIKFQ
jgi:hypothetical protein